MAESSAGSARISEVSGARGVHRGVIEWEFRAAEPRSDADERYAADDANADAGDATNAAATNATTRPDAAGADAAAAAATDAAAADAAATDAGRSSTLKIFYRNVYLRARSVPIILFCDKLYSAQESAFVFALGFLKKQINCFMNYYTLFFIAFFRK